MLDLQSRKGGGQSAIWQSTVKKVGMLEGTPATQTNATWRLLMEPPGWQFKQNVILKLTPSTEQLLLGPPAQMQVTRYPTAPSAPVAYLSTQTTPARAKLCCLPPSEMMPTWHGLAPAAQLWPAREPP